MENINQKECIKVNFSEGLSIFDDHYGYPEIDSHEPYNGPTGKVKDIQGIQAHAGINFFVPEGKNFRFDIDECPELHIAIKAEEGTNTCLILCVGDKEPREHIRRYVVIGKTPEGNPRLCNLITNCFEIKDDGEWHEYTFDLRKIREKQDDGYPYYPNASSVCMIQFYSWTGSKEHTFYFNDLSSVAAPNFIVHGKVHNNDDKPISGLTVKAFDRNVGVDDYLLGQAVTDKQGNYSISYDSGRLSGKTSADLVLSVYQNNKLLQESGVIFDARPVEERDFIVTVDKLPELHILTNKIQPLLRNNVKLPELSEKHISFLSQKTGAEVRQIENLAEAKRLANDDENLEAFYYGLLSQDFPTDPSALLNRDRTSITRALHIAESFRLIPALKPQEIDRILDEKLPELRADSLLKPAEVGKQASLGDLLHTMPELVPDDDNHYHRKIADLVAKSGVDYYKLQDQLKSLNFNQDQRIGIERTLRLGDLTSRHLPLLVYLQEVTKEDPDASLKSLAKIKRDNWIDKAYKFGVPIEVGLSPEAYAERMEKTIEELHPTTMLAARLNSGDLRISRPGFEKVGTFIDNNPDFDILHTNVPAFVDKAKLEDIEDKDQLINSLLKIQRVKKLSTTMDDLSALLNNGLDSALDVVALGEDRLQRYLADQVEPEKATVIYQYAKKTHDISLALMTRVMPRFSPTSVLALGNAIGIKDYPGLRQAANGEGASGEGNREGSEIDYATLQQLFGPLDYCECSHDQSVLSPAAYFVDLLQFLNNAKSTENDESNKVSKLSEPIIAEHALNVLLTRRPDLADLELSYNNTEIELPYIDLVLEILENAVAFAPPYSIANLKYIDAILSQGSQDPQFQKIVEVLKTTTLDMIGNDLKVTKELRPLTSDRIDTWIIADQQHRWTLHNQSGCMITNTEGLRPEIISNKEMDSKLLIDELGNNRLPFDLKKRIDKLLSQSNKRRYFSISNYTILPLEQEKKWKITCQLGVNVTTEVNDEQGKLILETPYETMEKTYSMPAFEAIVSGLNSGLITGPLCAFIPASKSYQITPNKEKDSWSITPANPDVTVILTVKPDNLSIIGLSYQTAGNSDDLKAAPANQNPLAYDKLRQANFPWSLPFNLPLEAVRAYLDRIGITRRQLIEVGDPERYLDDLTSVYEILGISSEEANLIVNSATPYVIDYTQLWKNWGLAPDAEGNVSIIDASAGEEEKIVKGLPLQVLSKVSILLQQARISYNDLMKVLQTRCISRNGTINFTFDNPIECCPCKIHITQISTEKDSLGPKLLDQIHRFVRFWRKLGWDINELDQAFLTFHLTFASHTEDFISSDTLKHISHIQILQEILDIPLKVLISWWGGKHSLLYHPNTFSKKPMLKTLYEQLFLNPNIQNHLDIDFALNCDQSDLLNPNSKTLSEKADLISAAFGINQKDFNQLLVQSKLENLLTLNNLFELYRTVGLVNALGISISDYYTVISLMDCSPFDSAKETIKFCKTVKFIQKSGFTIEELSYLLQNEKTAGSSMVLSDDQAAQKLRDIRSAIQTKLGAIDHQVQEMIKENHGGVTIKKYPLREVADDKASLMIGFSDPDDNASNVTANLSLPASGPAGTTINWYSSNSSIIDTNNGTVNRPSFLTGDAKVNLTAIISKGDSSDTKDFELNVSKLPQTDSESVAADKAALTISFISPLDNFSRVTGNLILPTSGANGSKITWSSSNSGVINLKDGMVNRPDFTSGDIELTLTATIVKGTFSDTKTFKLTIIKSTPKENQAVITDSVGLAISFTSPLDNPSRVTGNLILPTSGANGSKITWSSSDPNRITDSTVANHVAGIVTRPSLTESDAPISLEATVSMGSSTVTKKFENLIVRKQPQTDIESLRDDKSALIIDFSDPDDNVSNVTANLSLHTSGPAGTTINWYSSNSSIIDPNNGTVNRPSFLTGDAKVNLTAIISKGDSSDTKDFELNVSKLPQTDSESVAADKAALTISFISPLDNLSRVTGNLILPTSGANGSKITWSSSNSEVIFVNGKLGVVRRPDLIAGEDKLVSVTLMATIKKNSFQDSQNFNLTVFKLNDDDAVAAEKTSLTIGFKGSDNASSVTGNLILPSSGGYLFNWNEITGKDSARFIDFLKFKFGIDWVNKENVRRGNDNKTISITTGDNSLSLVNKNNKVDLEINGIKTEEFIAKVENGELNVYSKTNGTKIEWYSSNPKVVNPNNGIVIRPDPDKKDISISLKATITKGTSLDTKFFYSQELLDKPPLDENRLECVLSDPGLHAQLSDVVLGQVASLFSLELPVARKLLITDSTQSALLKNPSDINKDGIEVLFDSLFVSSNEKTAPDRNTFPDAFRLVYRLHKTVIFLSHLNVKPVEITWFANPAFDMTALNFNDLPNDLPSICLFCWEDIPGNDNEKLIKFLEQKYDLGWARETKIEKTEDNKILTLSSENNSLIFTLNGKKTKLTLIINGVQTDELTVKEENGKLNIYLENPELFQYWKRLVTLFQIRDISPKMAALLDKYITAIRSPDLAEGAGQAKKVLANGLEVQNTSVILATRLLGIKKLDQYRDPLKLKELLDFLYALKRLGGTSNDLRKLTTSPDVDSEMKARSLLRAKYGADAWREIIKPISDVLRVRQRDALVDYLIHYLCQEGKQVRDANNLYEYYLIDPQMSPNMMTSRLVQSTAAVQLFIQRCLLNLEDVTLYSDDRKRWEWMKNYRVWEANRKVFLYPENWLYPELRGDKTHIFRQLESGIAQGEPNYQLAEEKLLIYMDEFAEIAKVKVYGMYDDFNPNSKEHTLYVIGRTPDQPYSYYWRKCEKFGKKDVMRWYGWEPIEVNLSDDHVMPFVWEGDLHIAWPAITLKNASNTDGSEDLWWEIALNWARYTKHGWTKKKVSTETIGNDKSVKCQQKIKDALKEFTFRIGSDPSIPESVIFNAYNIQYNLEKSSPPDEAKLNDPHATDNPIIIQNNNPLNDDSAIFTLQLFDQYEVPMDNGNYRTFWAPVSNKPVSFYFYCGSKDNKYISFGVKVEWVYTDVNGLCIVKLPGNFFDKHIEKECVNSVILVSGIVSTGVHKFEASVIPLIGGISVRVGYLNDNVVFNYKVSDQITKNTSWTVKKILRQIKLKPPYQIVPVARFVITNSEDIKVELNVLDELSFAKDMECFANGFQSNVLKTGNCLNYLPIDNPVSPQLLIFQSVPSAIHNFFVLPASKNKEIINTQIIDNWYYEDSLIKLYLQLEWNRDINTVPAWSAIVDGINHIAKQLRSNAYVDIISLYSPVIQNQYYKESALEVYGKSSWTWYESKSLVKQGIIFDLAYPSALYYWEIFLHIPLLIAEFLTKHQRFEDAQRWLHHIFNPINPVYDNQTIGAAQFWQFLPFRQAAGGESIQKLLDLLADPNAKWSDKTEFISEINNWKDHPFLPDSIARMALRWTAYQWRTLFAYLDNLIAWGDQMFRRNTRESINEATILYILATKLLGPRPQSIKRQLQPPSQSYRDLYGKWDKFSNAWNIFTNNHLILSMLQSPGRLSSDDVSKYEVKFSPADPQTKTLSSLGMLYFCVPSNDKLLEYWNKVEDRLFKIRNCMNIEGITQDLPLFAPPIDPGLLVRATAAGLDIATILSDMSAPLLPYRFNVLLQKTNEICAEVKSLGACLLACLEKKDAEELALKRSSQEIDLLNLITYIKEQQIEEAKENLVVLNQNMAVVKERFSQYQKLLGKPSFTLDQEGLPVLETTSPFQVAVNSLGEEAGLALIQYEVDQFNSLKTSNSYQEAAGYTSTVSGVLHAIPDSIMGTVSFQSKFGGSHLGSAAGAVASYLNMKAGSTSYEANKKNILAGYYRRLDEWVHQSKLALEEMKHIKKQIIAAEIRKDIAEHELENHKKQIEHAQKISDFMHDKYTNQELYSWMVGEISGVYFNSYQLAYDMAKRTEGAFQWELGVENTNFIKFGYWDSLKKGLLSGESLSLDLKRMEMAYLEQNRRELEITKHVSLLQLDPYALLQLKITGSCELTIPEWFYDLDCPGHYMRRIKTISLSIPCITGPYISINCKLSLLKSTIRVSPRLKDSKYERIVNEEDNRFKDYYGSIQSIVTSNAQNDSGLFETNLHDERYLPCELSGAVSQWRLELPSEVRQFDFNTISDVILHVRYTARDGGDLLKSGAIKNLRTLIDSAQTSGSVRLFSVRHEFPTEWAKFKSVDINTTPTAKLSFLFLPQHYPFWAQDLVGNRKIKVNAVDVFAKMPPAVKNDSLNLYDKADPFSTNIKRDTLNQNPSVGNLLSGNLEKIDKPKAITESNKPWTLYFDNNNMEELWIAVAWGKA